MAMFINPSEVPVRASAACLHRSINEICRLAVQGEPFTSELGTCSKAIESLCSKTPLIRDSPTLEDVNQQLRKDIAVLKSDQLARSVPLKIRALASVILEGLQPAEPGTAEEDFRNGPYFHPDIVARATKRLQDRGLELPKEGAYLSRLTRHYCRTVLRTAVEQHKGSCDAYVLLRPCSSLKDNERFHHYVMSFTSQRENKLQIRHALIIFDTLYQRWCAASRASTDPLPKIDYELTDPLQRLCGVYEDHVPATGLNIGVVRALSEVQMDGYLSTLSNLTAASSFWVVCEPIRLERVQGKDAEAHILLKPYSSSKRGSSAVCLIEPSIFEPSPERKSLDWEGGDSSSESLSSSEESSESSACESDEDSEGSEGPGNSFDDPEWEFWEQWAERGTVIRFWEKNRLD